MPIRRPILRALWFPLVVWIVAAHLAFGRAYLIAFNLTESLPGALFLIEKGTLSNRGDLVAFRWQAYWPYPQGSLFVKRLVGVPGSIVSAAGREFFVDGQPVGRAKENAKTGQSLEMGPVGTIPEAHYYVAGAHPDSLDSRYRLTGWVERQQVVGKAHRIF